MGINVHNEIMKISFTGENLKLVHVGFTDNKFKGGPSDLETKILQKY